MYNSLLIANRGEIALRIQRACRALGIASIQVYSEADAGADYIRSADRAVCIGPPPSSSSYLDKKRILLAAAASGAGAIHPGYGFLSENAEFAAMVERAGLIFVGPPSAVIGRMGDKIAAKAAMLDAGVPCVPGLKGEFVADDASIDSLKHIGFPVIVKAAGGGGGRGMRVVESEKDLLTALATTRQEAQKAFGNPTIYIERYLQNPRHVEIQVLADGYGNCIWIGSRDCSVQRRHQKVMEEAPALNIPDNLLEKVGSRCVEACKALGYVGAGTFEFLYQDGEMYFIEMNTRLQVEHTITEMVSGIDLVQQQLRIARGERLQICQDDISLQGHALECRINAEDPITFLPSSGKVTFWQVPGGPGLRVDTHVSSGWVVSPYYDSMVAKVISFGRSREEAIERMRSGLKQFCVEGVKTNIPLHLQVLDEPSFNANDITIHFLERGLAKR